MPASATERGRHVEIPRDTRAERLLLRGRPGGIVRDAPLRARQHAPRHGDDRVDPQPAHVAVVPACSQRVGEPLPPQRKQGSGALLLVQALSGLQFGSRCGHALVQASPFLGKGFPHARA